ncbi:unnamed protein product, partial [Brassica rapa subsp. narinosa]
ELDIENDDEEYSLSVYDILKVWEESTRTATQQGSGKLGKWKINFVYNLKFKISPIKQLLENFSQFC